MARSVAILEQKQQWMRETQQVPQVAGDQQATLIQPAALERHYAVAEVAAAWNLSADVVRKLFDNEPGVIAIGREAPVHRRRYVTLRIPASVLERVHQRLRRG